MSQKIMLPLAVLAIVFFVHSTFAGVVEGPIYNPANGHAYYLLNSASWTISESEAENLGGTLTTINDAAENTWVFDTFAPTAESKGYDLWIGYYDPDTNDGTGAQHAADFIWIDGETPSYTNWSAGEPNGDPELNDEADYAAMTAFSHDSLTPGEWNDKSNTSSTTGSMGVVEVVPEPLSLKIACTMALIGLATRPRLKSARNVEWPQ